MNSSEVLIFLLSDGTGETGDSIIRATMTQYEDPNFQVIRYKSLRSKEQVDAILEEAEQQKAMVVFTAVSAEVREAIIQGVIDRKIEAVDLLGPVLERFSRAFDLKPASKPGLLHAVNENYFKRIEAMEFSVKQDDGAHPENLAAADIVLVGVSRTSKTPLSIYLSHKGWKVANVPLIKGIDPPESLFKVEQSKIIALIIDPESLSKIRRERLVRMGRDPTGDYASIQHIREEIEWSRQLFSRNRRWPVFNVTNKALEETATEIERVINTKRRLSKMAE